MKKFVFGIILGAGLMMGVSANAEVVNYVGKVIEGQFPVKVDGKIIESPGIVIDGTSYLPTRTIAELAGFDVSFDADMGVELKKKISSQPEPTVPTTPVPEVTTQPEPSLTKEQIRDRIEYIEGRLRTLQMQINMTQQNIDNPNASEKDRQDSIEGLEKLLNLKSKLEAEKAELEAQLNAQ